MTGEINDPAALIENFFLTIPLIWNQHAPGSYLYNFLCQAMRKEIEALFSSEDAHARSFSALGVGMFAQKINWQPVQKLSDVPASYHDGTLFISSKDRMPWT